jgi:uncharacterized protein (TIGR02453 family)
MLIPAPTFSRETLPFVIRASRQKRPDWLDRHREEYERLVIQPMQAIARHLKAELASEANGYHFPQRGLGRLKRSQSAALEYGRPFRDYLSYTARRPAKSRFDHNPSIFLFIYPADGEGDEVLLAGGLYMPSSRQLKSIRQAIATNAKPFDRLFASPAFAARFPEGFSDERKSKRVPRGFDANHPRIEWLKLQGYFVWRSYKPRDYTSKKFGELLVKDARQILRLNDLLEQAIGGRWVGDGAKNRKEASPLVEALDGLQPITPREMDF